MTIIPASECQKNFGHFKEVAQREPVIVTSNGRESVVIISATEYREYKKYKEGNIVTSSFKQEVDRFIDKHDEVLKGLA